MNDPRDMAAEDRRLGRPAARCDERGHVLIRLGGVEHGMGHEQALAIARDIVLACCRAAKPGDRVELSSVEDGA